MNLGGVAVFLDECLAMSRRTFEFLKYERGGLSFLFEILPKKESPGPETGFQASLSLAFPPAWHD